MPYWEALGREVILMGSEETCERISQHLAFLGLDSSVAVDSATDSFVVSVPAAQFEEASNILTTLNAKEESGEDYINYENESKTASPAYITAADRYNNSTGFALFFIGLASCVFMMALVHILTAVHTGNIPNDAFAWASLILGVILLAVGLRFLIRARHMRDGIAVENAFTLQVVEWCISTYSPSHIDQTIKASSGPPPVTYEAVTQRRKGLIKSYISREFNVEDASYLQYLADEAYTSIFEKRKLHEAASVSFGSFFKKKK